MQTRKARLIAAAVGLIAIIVLIAVITYNKLPALFSIPTPPTSTAFSGQVVNKAGIAVAGATVYLVPTTAIDMTQITATGVYAPPYPAEAYDEPLEDAIRLKGAGFPQATTDAQGRFTISEVPDGKFFVHVTPSANDTEHLPGGSRSRFSIPADQLRGESATITVSSRPPADAKYVGSTACLACHKEDANWRMTGHKLSFMQPGAPGPMQDTSRLPDVLKAIPYFVESDTYQKGTHLEAGDYDAKRDTDKFLVRVFNDERLPIKTVYADLYLWKNKADSKYYITIVNRLNPQDPNSPANLEVKLTYGGMVFRQRFVVSVPSQLGDRKGWYVFLEYHSVGSDARLNPERRVWEDYHLDLWWSPGADGAFGSVDDALKAPPINEQTMQAMCAGCHFTGFERYVDSASGQFLARAVSDPNGEVDIDGDGKKDEINIGCETCHGPGSKHVESNSARYTVNPKYLSAERSNMICGRCHDRRQGVGGPILGYTMPINKDGKIMPPGESRTTLLAQYVDSIQKGPIPGKHIWPDDLFSKFPHQQYADFLKSKMYKNDRILVTCSDCHDMHGNTPYRRWLLDNPDDPTSSLCQRCHAVDLLAHMQTKLNAQMKGLAQTRCIDCHMPKTAIGGPATGAAQYGRFITTPPFANAADEAQNAYWEGYERSHVFKVPFKTDPGVKGILPGLAMPIPYTSSCGTCHVVNELPFK